MPDKIDEFFIPSGKIVMFLAVRITEGSINSGVTTGVGSSRCNDRIALTDPFLIFYAFKATQSG